MKCECGDLFRVQGLWFYRYFLSTIIPCYLGRELLVELRPRKSRLHCICPLITESATSSVWPQ
jgi:hypothetical protein